LISEQQAGHFMFGLFASFETRFSLPRSYSPAWDFCIRPWSYRLASCFVDSGERTTDRRPQRPACAVANVGVSTLSDWRKADPELEARIDAAKEKLREKCLQTFSKALEENDWRAADALMKLVFPEYRQNSKVEVSASASSVSFPTLTPEVIASLQERRKQLLAEVSR
jgi:hypothetical protein